MLYASYLLGLLVLSVGVLGIVLSFNIADRKKYLTALTLSGLVSFLGATHYAVMGLRQIGNNRRMAQFRSRETINMDAIRQRMMQQGSMQNPPSAVPSSPKREEPRRQSIPSKTR